MTAIRQICPHRKQNRYRSELDLVVAVAGIIAGFPQGFLLRDDH